MTTSQQKYFDKNFTEDGVDLIDNYARNLIMIYHKNLTNEYPIKLGQTLGLPMFEYTQRIETRKEHEGRIKQLMQLLGTDSIELDDGTTFEVS